MYYGEKITSEMIRKLQAGEDDRHYKTCKNRIVFSRKCKYCSGEFWPSRKNHYYCSDSCKVIRCRKGKEKHLQKNDKSLPIQQSQIQPNSLINLRTVGESALGNAAVSGLKYMLHDQHVMKKLDQILTTLEGGVSSKVPVSVAPLQFRGMSNTGLATLALFQHPKTGKLFACDQHNRWMQQVSSQPEKWEWL